MRITSSVLKATTLAAVGVGLLAGLYACEERPYSVPLRQAVTPAPKTAVLAGGPAYGAPAEQTNAAPPAYVEAPLAAAPTSPYAEPPAYTPPPAQTYRPAPAYDTGGPMIVAMAPIPNPPEHRGRRYGPRPTLEPGSVAPHHTHAHAAPATTPARPVHAAAPKPAYAHAPPTQPTQAKATPPQATPNASPPQATAAKAPPPQATAVKPATAMTVADKAKADAAKVEAADKAKADAAKPVAAATAKPDLAKPVAVAPAPTVPAPDDRTTKLAALQSALTDVVAKTGVLTFPAHFSADQPADVSLTLPAGFADTLHKEADKQGLSAAAVSANMTSALAGDGYTVTPGDSQSQPLTIGQPTEFHWSVNAKPDARGPLHADVGAVLLGAGLDTLSLGSVQQNAGMPKLDNKLLGAGILALIVILVLGWLARGRNSPSRSGAARRAGRAARGDGFNRPLDIAPRDTDPSGDIHP